MKVKLIKCPSNEDWMFCKQCALVTVGKDAITEPTQEWKHKILEARHSPIRVLQFAFELGRNSYGFETNTKFYNEAKKKMPCFIK